MWASGATVSCQQNAFCFYINPATRVAPVPSFTGQPEPAHHTPPEPLLPVVKPPALRRHQGRPSLPGAPRPQEPGPAPGGAAVDSMSCLSFTSSSPEEGLSLHWMVDHGRAVKSREVKKPSFRWVWSLSCGGTKRKPGSKDASPRNSLEEGLAPRGAGSHGCAGESREVEEPSFGWA